MLQPVDGRSARLPWNCDKPINGLSAMDDIIIIIITYLLTYLLTAIEFHSVAVVLTLVTIKNKYT